MIGLVEQPSPVKPVRNRKGQFGPGNRANPKGRPKKGACLSEVVRTFLETKTGTGKAARSRLQALIARLYLEDPKTLLAYGYGKPVESLELTGPQGEPVEFKVAIGVEELP